MISCSVVKYFTPGSDKPVVRSILRDSLHWRNSRFDWQLNTGRSHLMIRHLAYILTLVAMVTSCEISRGQSLSNNFVLTVPAYMELTALRGPQFQSHPGTAADLTFTNSVWWARTASASGSTVTFTTDRAFQNVADASKKRDVRLRLPFMYVSPGSGWEFETNTDQSDYAIGDEIAAVQVTSSSAGVALVFMQVTFITGDVSTLTGGTYELTVTGTISQN